MSKSITPELDIETIRMSFRLGILAALTIAEDLGATLHMTVDDYFEPFSDAEEAAFKHAIRTVLISSRTARKAAAL